MLIRQKDVPHSSVIKHMNFYEEKEDVKRSNKSNLSKSIVTSKETNRPNTNVNFGIQSKPSPSRMQIQKQPKERYVKKVSRAKFVAPVEPINPNALIQPMKTNYTEVVFDSKITDPTQIAYRDQKITSIVEKVVSQKSQQYILKKEFSNLVNTELKQKIEKYLSSVKQDNLSKKDLETFVYDTIKKRIEEYSKKQLTPKDVEMLTHTILKSQKQPIGIEEINEIVKKHIGECMINEPKPNKNESNLSKDDLIELVKEFVSRKDVEKMTKDYVSKKDVENITKHHPSKDDVIEMTKDYISKIDVEYLTKDHTSKEEVAEMTKDYVSKIDVEYLTKDHTTKEEVAEMTKEFVSKVDVEYMTKDYASKHDLYEVKKEIIELVDSKVEAVNMSSLVEKYTREMILRGEDETNDENDDEPQTLFEEIISPSVARIINRVMKYDQACSTPADDTASLNLEWQHDDVYKKELSQSYERPQLKHIDNPMYDVETQPVLEEDVILDLGSVYKDSTASEGKVMFKNDLRTNARKNRRWSHFGNGIESGNVIDIFLDKVNKKIYIAGHFKHVNRVPMENIAVYDMNLKQWKHIGEGIPQLATSIAVDEENEHVYVGGVFSTVGKGENAVSANNIAMFSVNENKWYSLGDGLNRDCTSIVYDANTKSLFVGGSFTQSGKMPIHYVAIYDTIKKIWSPLKGGSVNGPCRVLLKPNEKELYLGGLFTHTEDGNIHVSYVAKYNLETDKWSDLAGGLQGYCNAMSYDSKRNSMYVGGTFINVGYREQSINAHHVARFDIGTNTWDDMNGGLNNVVQSLHVDNANDCVYVGGTFTQTFENDMVLNYIAKYNSDKREWQSLENHFANSPKPPEDIGNDNIGLNGVCKVISMDSKSLFIAGKFQIAGNITANSIARYALKQ